MGSQENGLSGLSTSKFVTTQLSSDLATGGDTAAAALQV